MIEIKPGDLYPLLSRPDFKEVTNYKHLEMGKCGNTYYRWDELSCTWDEMGFDDMDMHGLLITREEDDMDMHELITREEREKINE